VEFNVQGGTTPVVVVTLRPGEKLGSEAGELGWLRGDVEIATGTSVAGQQGGLFKAAKRAFGGSFFVQEFTAGSGGGEVTFAAKAPGEIRLVELSPGHDVVVHENGLMCFEIGVSLETHFQKKLGVGAFGGTGFTLQRLSGSGRAYVELHGDVVEFDLAAGEKLRTHPGHVGLFDATVTLNLTTIPGIKNKFFGGEGLFLTELVGPGKVWLQSITLAGLAQALSPYLVSNKEVGEGAALATGAAILGGLLKK
jgi:uncharacterized protein (AIM24 family)